MPVKKSISKKPLFKWKTMVDIRVMHIKLIFSIEYFFIDGKSSINAIGHARDFKIRVIVQRRVDENRPWR